VRNSPQTLENVVTYDVVLDVDNVEGLLKPGMTASVSVVTAEKDDVLKVPTAALRFRPPADEDEDQSGAAMASRPTSANKKPGEGTVYRLVRGEPKPVPVVIGLADESMTAIESTALGPDDRVVTRIKPEVEEPQGWGVFSGGRGRR
jgi:HlyD family secretion protein